MLGNSMRRVRRNPHDSDPEFRGRRKINMIEPGGPEGKEPHPEAGEILDHLPVNEIVHEHTDRIGAPSERCGGVVELRLQEPKIMAGVGFAEVGFVPRPRGVDRNIHTLEPTPAQRVIDCEFERCHPYGDERSGCSAAIRTGMNEAAIGRAITCADVD